MGNKHRAAFKYKSLDCKVGAARRQVSLCFREALRSRLLEVHFGPLASHLPNHPYQTPKYSSSSSTSTDHPNSAFSANHSYTPRPPVRRRLVRMLVSTEDIEELGEEGGEGRE